MPRSFLFTFLCAFFAGIAAGEIWRVSVQTLFIAIACAIVGLSWKYIHWPALIILGLCLGILRLGNQLQSRQYDVVTLVGTTVTVNGTIVQPSSVEDTRQVFTLTEVKQKSIAYQGKVLISTAVYPRLPTGVDVQVTCPITELTPQSKLRQWSHGIHARCTAYSVKTLGVYHHSWRATLGRWQDRLLMYVRQHFNEPQASLLNGILIGNTDGMPDRLQQSFQATGTTHIVALSGFNVTIIMAIVVGWLVKVVGRRWAWMPALMLLIAFVVMSGASSSVVRAAVMAIIVQLGLFIGRPVSIGRLLAYTALLMVWFNPLVLWHDVGFQLSFLATIGLVALAKPMAAKLLWVTEHFGIRESLATTLAAIVMTEPLLLWRFGRISLIAPLVNVLVLPLVPITMGIGAISIFGMFLPFISFLVVPVTDSVLRLIVWIIVYGASLPNSLIYLSPIVTIVSGTLFTIIAIILSRHHVQEHHTA